MIKFGTDGWRGIISDAFTFQNVELVSLALSKLIAEDDKLPNKILVGYDRRFLSDKFALTAAKTMSENGIEVLFADKFLPTPVFSWAAKYYGNFAGAVVITASHNPFEYNGFKIKENFGGSASPQTTKKVEDKIKVLLKMQLPKSSLKADNDVFNMSFDKTFNPFEDYKNAVKKFISPGIIKNLKGTILIEPMNGSGSGYLAQIMKELGVNVSEIHGESDPLFRGVNPEPIASNLKDTIDYCKRNKPLSAFVLDGDSDRIAAIDENGDYFNSQQVFSLVAWHFLKNRNRKDGIAKTVSTTHIINRLAEKYCVKVHEVPIGFKYIAQKMIDGEVFLGGEESGGIGLFEHIPERDPILISLLVLELMAIEQKGIKALYEMICDEVGPAYFERRDYHINPLNKAKLISNLKNNPPKVIAGKKVINLSAIDGFKFILDDNTWVLIRASGTEPVLRIYAETPTSKDSLNLIDITKSMVD